VKKKPAASWPARLPPQPEDEPHSCHPESYPVCLLDTHRTAGDN
jgi:hypothetical protein